MDLTKSKICGIKKVGNTQSLRVFLPSLTCVAMTLLIDLGKSRHGALA